MKTLIAFFSMKGQTIAPGMKIVDLEKGHTAVVAETIRSAIGGDLFEMETIKTYNPDHMTAPIRSMSSEKRIYRRPNLRMQAVP